MNRFSKPLFNRLTRHPLFACGVLMAVILGGCHKFDFPWNKHHSEKYPADVAIAWMNLQLRLTKGSPGFNSIVANRSYAYVGFSLYESIAQGMRGYESIASQLSGSLKLPVKQHGKEYYWPASANAALAYISKYLFANTTQSLFFAIDSLESDFNKKFKNNTGSDELARSIDFGKQVAKAIFEWSKSDGGHEGYNKITSDTYVPPTGPGRWIPTPPGFGKAIHNSWGNNRCFLKGLVDNTQADPPPVYSQNPGSDFYKAVSYIYVTSQHLSAKDSLTARFWADLPANYNVPAHAANIVTQLVISKKLDLLDAAVLYCKHGIAGNEALITCFATKYKYNLVRPISYIRTILNKPDWNTVVPTPAFPEYTSAHSVVSAAFAAVLEEKFGKNFSFTDNTYQNLYGARSFRSFEEYAAEAAYSRILGGIHYDFAATEGMKQGRKVGKEVNRLVFKKDR